MFLLSNPQGIPTTPTLYFSMYLDTLIPYHINLLITDGRKHLFESHTCWCQCQCCTFLFSWYLVVEFHQTWGCFIVTSFRVNLIFVTFTSFSWSAKNKWAGPCENMSLGICRQQRPRSDCTFVQSDLGLHCLPTESLDTTECMNGEQRPGWYFAHYDLNQNQRHCLTWPKYMWCQIYMMGRHLFVFWGFFLVFFFFVLFFLNKGLALKFEQDFWLLCDVSKSTLSYSSFRSYISWVSTFSCMAGQERIQDGLWGVQFDQITILTLHILTDLSKQCRPRSDVAATECGIWSGSTLFATHPAILHTLTGKIKRRMRWRVRDVNI